MAEIVICVKDRSSSTFREYAGQFHVGEVITIKPDGWQWATREFQNPNWIIVRADITDEEVDAFLSPELDLLGVKPVVFKRKQRIDLDQLAFLAKTNVTKVLPLSKKQLKDLRGAVVQNGNLYDLKDSWK